MNGSGESLDHPGDHLQNHRDFQRVLDLLNSWFQWKTKLHIGLFHEFYMVRFEGWIVQDKPGYYFQPEGGGAMNVIFFADPTRGFKIRDIGGRTSLTLGEVSPTGSAIMLTEDVDELIQFAMHLKPVA